MARVKRGVIARARHKKIMKQAKGYYGARSRVYRVALSSNQSRSVRLPRPSSAQASVPSAVDCTYQRCCSPKWFVLQPLHQWPEKGFC